MYDLLPLIETWLEQQGFAVSVLANRVDAIKKTGFFSSEKMTVFLEDYVGLCSVRTQGNANVCQLFDEYLKSLPPKAEKQEKETLLKETIVKEREIVTIVCSYCKTLVRITERKCPSCGASIIG